MLTTSLLALEQRLEACLLELEETHLSRPGLPTAMARADAGRRLDKLYEQMVELQEQIVGHPAKTLEDAAVKLRRLSAYVEEARPMRLLADVGFRADYVCFTPSSRRSGQGWECLKLTQPV